MLESYLFATVVMHSFHINQVFYHHTSLILMLLHILSVIMPLSPVGAIADCIETYLAFFYFIPPFTYFIVFPVIVLGLWLASRLLPARRVVLRRLKTLVAVAGAHIYLIQHP